MPTRIHGPLLSVLLLILVPFSSIPLAAQHAPNRDVSGNDNNSGNTGYGGSNTSSTYGGGNSSSRETTGNENNSYSNPSYTDSTGNNSTSNYANPTTRPEPAARISKSPLLKRSEPLRRVPIADSADPERYIKACDKNKTHCIAVEVEQYIPERMQGFQYGPASESSAPLFDCAEHDRAMRRYGVLLDAATQRQRMFCSADPASVQCSDLARQVNDLRAKIPSCK